jgi:hypothetical protein
MTLSQPGLALCLPCGIGVQDFPQKRGAHVPLRQLEGRFFPGRKVGMVDAGCKHLVLRSESHGLVTSSATAAG